MAALPLGNGKLGAMVFGGVAHERIQFNESTVWTVKIRYQGKEVELRAAAGKSYVFRSDLTQSR
jgi:hypothetical protein